eukprot:symbB.v1.2.040241.t1/scaffold7094.1/size21202/1
MPRQGVRRKQRERAAKASKSPDVACSRGKGSGSTKGVSTPTPSVRPVDMEVALASGRGACSEKLFELKY